MPPETVMVKKDYLRDIRDPINEVVDELNGILNHRQKEKYYYGILLSFSLAEFMLKWITFIEGMWRPATKVAQKDFLLLWDSYQEFFAKTTLYNLIREAFLLQIIDLDLYKSLDKMRKERNELVHKLWIENKRNDFRFLRNKLEFYASIENRLVKRFNRISNKVGIEEIFHYHGIKKLLR